MLKSVMGQKMVCKMRDCKGISCSSLQAVIVASALSLVIVTGLANAAESSSHGLSILGTVGLVCKAHMDAPEFDATQQTLSIVVHELCNGGSGYTLALIHDGKGVDSMHYDSYVVPDIAPASTVLATRSGAWVGSRVLTLSINGSVLPVIYGVQLRQHAVRL